MGCGAYGTPKEQWRVKNEYTVKYFGQGLLQYCDGVG
jgi:hypothetical protein